jgi:hypothetical protein
MPKLLENLRKKIAKGEPGLAKSSTYAIATAALQKQGKMKQGSQQLTAKGKAYQASKSRGRG